MLIVRWALPLAVSVFVSAAALACAAPVAKAGETTSAGRVGLAAPAASAYSAPSGAWSQFTSELSSASGVASGQGVTIAILDDGVDASAPGLSDKVTVGPRYFDHDSAPPRHSDGTMEASVIAGTPGVLQGAAPKARILDLRVFPTDSGKRESLNKNYDATEGPILAKAITYAVAHRAQVIEVNQLVGSDGAPKSLVTAVSDAVAKGAVIVAPAISAGQFGGYLYPESAPGVIGVASVMLPGGRDPSRGITSPGSPSASAKNDSVLVAGPGDWVQALPDGWGPYGASAATPYVTATAALIKQRYPHLAPGLVERAIAMSARDKPSGGYDTQVGFGVVDPYDAVLDAATFAKVTTAAAPGPGVAAAGTHFGTGPLPGPVHALPSALWQIILSCAGIVVGVALLAFAVITVRRRRKAGKDAAPSPGPVTGTGEAPEAAPA